MTRTLVCWMLGLLLLSVGVASADPFGATIDPSRVKPGDNATLTLTYSVDAPTVIQNVAQLWIEGVLRAEVSVPLTVETDSPALDVELRVPATAGVTALSATATLPDGSTMSVTPGADGSVRALVGDVLPGQGVVLAVLMLVL